MEGQTDAGKLQRSGDRQEAPGFTDHETNEPAFQA